MIRPRSSPLAGLALATALMAPAMAQSSIQLGVDPRAAPALNGMRGVAAEYCRGGSQDACAFSDRLGVLTTRMIAAQEACGRGVQASCEAVERGVAELTRAYERFGGERSGAPRTPGAGPGLGN